MPYLHDNYVDTFPLRSENGMLMSTRLLADNFIKDDHI